MIQIKMKVRKLKKFRNRFRIRFRKVKKKKMIYNIFRNLKNKLTNWLFKLIPGKLGINKFWKNMKLRLPVLKCK